MSWWFGLLVTLATLVAIWAGFVLWLVLARRRSEARALATFVPDCVVLVSRLAGDARVPRRRKLLLLGVVAYLVSPLDLVPDFIPVVGQLDDAVVVALVLRHFVKTGGEPLISELWPGPGAVPCIDPAPRFDELTPAAARRSVMAVLVDVF